MLRILERKRAEKRALENIYRFHCDPKRHWKTPKHPVVPKMAKRRVASPDASPSSPVVSMPRPWRVPTERPTGLYAALHAPATAAEMQPGIRRRRSKGINAKRLKEAVEKVRKPSLHPARDRAADPLVELMAEHPVDIWHGRHHPEQGQDGPHAFR